MKKLLLAWGGGESNPSTLNLTNNQTYEKIMKKKLLL